MHSEQPDELVRFYKDVVGLTPRFEMTAGAFSVSESSRVDVIIEPHSEVVGAARDPKRVLLNFLVEDAVAEERRLKSRDVRFVRDVTEEPGVGLFGTFVDPDGNYCQLVELRG